METILSVETFNTNNDWGFGGSRGTVTHYNNDISIYKGVYCYRHAQSISFTKVCYKGSTVRNGRLTEVKTMPTKLFKYISETALDMYSIEPLKETNGKIIVFGHVMTFDSEIQL